MSDDVRVLFREVAGLEPVERQNCYARQQTPTAVRVELESLLSFDATSGESITAVVRDAAGEFLLSSAPVSGERRCGAYRLIRLLGNGGMGAVYLAERADGEVEQKVAIKFLRAGHDLPSFRSRFPRSQEACSTERRTCRDVQR